MSAGMALIPWGLQPGHREGRLFFFVWRKILNFSILILKIALLMPREWPFSGRVQGRPAHALFHF
jgi:hypothetical protein